MCARDSRTCAQADNVSASFSGTGGRRAPVPRCHKRLRLLPVCPMLPGRSMSYAHDVQHAGQANMAFSC